MSTTIPFGRLSKRHVLLFIASLFATVFSYLLVMTAPVHAADGDAKWEQGSIVYEDATFRGPTTPNPANNYELPDNTVMYIDKSASTLRVIYFPPGTDTTKASNAQFVTYSLNSSGKVSNKSEPKTIQIDTSTSDEATSTANPNATSCAITGIGWLVCSVTNFLATGMDWVFEALSGFVEVQPLSTNTDNTMHRVWDIMRGFANVAFVIAFLVIIYSQLTSVGMSNYGIKKLLPRIIIAAILVNVSYWICAIAIDLSNILGYSLQGVFLGLRDTVLTTGSTGEGWQATSWESVAGFVLAGGAAGGAVVTGTILAGSTMGAFTAAGVALLLLPILLGAFLTVLVVLFIFAARQAIITILVIISPLALVAYLLPNTEKWFEKWRGLFTTMLVFFPAFSLVFGGAQFAGLMIITAAVSQEDINMLLLGMAVQIAPLAITPLLLRLSGSLLSKIGGIINDPSRGLKDRTRNWAKDRQAANKAGQDVKTREMAKNGTLRRRSFVRHAALGTDTRRRLREGNKSDNEARATALFDSTDAGYTLSRNQHRTSQMKESIDSELKTKLQMEINAEGSVLHADRIEVDAKKSMLKNEEGLTERMMSEYRTKEYSENVDRANMPYSVATFKNIHKIQQFEDEVAINGVAAQGAKRLADVEYAKRIEGSATLRTRAGGLEGEKGAERALAQAYSTVNTAYEESIKNAGAIINHGNYDDNVVVGLAKNQAGNTGINVTEDIQIAALRKIAGGKNADAISDLVRDMPNIPGLSQDVRQEFGDALLNNGARPVYVGAGTAAAFKAGTVTTNHNDRIDDFVIAAVKDGKFSTAATLVSQDKRYLQDAFESLKRNANIDTSPAIQRATQDMTPKGRAEYIAKYKAEQAKMVEQIHLMQHESRFSGSIGNRDENMGKLYEVLTKQAGVPAEYNSYQEAKKNKPAER